MAKRETPIGPRLFMTGKDFDAVRYLVRKSSEDTNAKIAASTTADERSFYEAYKAQCEEILARCDAALKADTSQDAEEEDDDGLDEEETT
jgi:hypothetical protein